MDIIDFRVRPLHGGYRAMVENGTADRFLTAFRCEKPESVAKQSVELLLREMDEAGVELAVVPGRQSAVTFVANEELVELTERYPGRFSVFPLFDPLRPVESLEEVRRLTVCGPCQGVSIEPGFGNDLLFDAEEYQCLYAFLEEAGLPLLTTFSGSITPVIDGTLPGRFHAMARRYPSMTMIAGHGGWPWFRELCSMAFFTRNIYLVPDLYSMRCPGEADVRSAANDMLRDRMLFGSSYPLLPVKAAVDNARGWNLMPDARELFFRENAARILKLQG